MQDLCLSFGGLGLPVYTCNSQARYYNPEDTESKSFSMLLNLTWPA